MNIDDLFGPQSPIIELQATDRWQAINELLDHLVALRSIDGEHRAAIGAAVRKREESMSTGIGHGIGLPHASTFLVRHMVAIIGRAPAGIQFGSGDGQPVKIVVVLFLVPEGEYQKYVHTLATIAKLIHNPDFRDGLWDRFR